MDNTKRHLSEQKPGSAGVAGDLRRLKSDGVASAAELREFLGNLKGRSPEDVMGAVAQSNLVRSIGLATVGCLGLMAVLTIIPYLLRDSSSSVAANSSVAAPVKDDSATQADTRPAAADSRSDLQTEASAAANAREAVDKMGIGGAADPDSNPDKIDNRLDKLLDGID